MSIDVRSTAPGNRRENLATYGFFHDFQCSIVIAVAPLQVYLTSRKGPLLVGPMSFRGSVNRASNNRTSYFGDDQTPQTILGSLEVLSVEPDFQIKSPVSVI